jgi:hypothetical protein
LYEVTLCLIFLSDISALERISYCRADIGRIYIKGYLYPIFYPKIAKKDIPLSFFCVGYVEGYNILILGIYKFLYPISFLEKVDNFGVILPCKMHFLC